jgi:hypothetical protein
VGICEDRDGGIILPEAGNEDEMENILNGETKNSKVSSGHSSPR